VRPPSLFEDVAGAILDGTPVDWAGVESAAAAADQPLVEQLKTLAALRSVRQSSDMPGGPATVSWGHLRVFERIGHGAFGDVHRAWDTRLDREVALKLLPPESDDADAPGSSVIEEGRLLARIRHPNVVTIYGAERIDGRVGLWMELVKGRTLEQALQDGTTFTSREVAHIGVELGRAVGAVHAAGLVHRDIKAQNVMVEDTGRLVLMDFGTGRELEGASDANVAGTPLYLAPEVLAGGTADARSDVYSIGVVLYHLLTGSYPVEGRDLADLRRAHAARAEATLPSSAREIPSRLRRVIARALDPNPERRPDGADALAASLSTLERGPALLRRTSYAAAAVVVMTVAAVVWGQREPTPAAEPASPSATTDAPVIAVMPFTNLSTDPDSDYFVDGLTAEVIRNLADIEGLQVRSQGSSFSLKGKPRDLALYQAQLGVNLILEASVLRVDDRLRATVQLVQVPDDVVLWSEPFDRRVDDVFAIQDEISTAIATRLRLTLGRSRRRYQTNLPAYEAYLRARTVVSRRGTESAQQAARLFQQVIDMDPTFALAHAGLADAYAEMSWQLTGLSLEEGLEGMRPAAEAALELDPQLAEAHAAMGLTYAREREWDLATASFERALDLNGTLTQVRVNYAQTLVTMGQVDKALQLLETARTTDPLSPMVKRELAWTEFIDRRFEEAITDFRAALEDDPGLPFTTQGLARALTFAGRPEEAIEVWLHKPASDGDWERWLAHAYVRAGRREDLDRLIEADRNGHPYRQALIYSALGDIDKTFEYLNQSVDVAPHRTAQMLVYPEMALLRGDPRLDALRTRLNLH
jgi:serine/threonine-protein kinase